MRCYDYNGKEFNSIQSMCKFYGISKRTYDNRIKRGLSMEEALKNRTKAFIAFKGKEITVEEFCKEVGMSRSSFYYELNSGRTVEEIAERHSRKSDYQLGCDILFEGKKFNSYKELCDYYGVKYDCFNKRRYRGYSLEDALKGKS